MAGMLYGFNHAFISPVVKEEQLKRKIYHLQSRMLDFHEKMSPAKDEDGKWTSDGFSRFDLLSCIAHWLSLVVRSILFLIGGTACIAWPLCFPAFVYLGEGTTLFFWQIAIVSVLIAIAMAVKMASDLLDMLHECFSNIHSVISSLWSEIKERLNNVLLTVQSQKYSVLKRDFKPSFVTRTFIVSLVTIGCTIALLVTVPIEQIVKTHHAIYAMLLLAGFLCGIWISGISNTHQKVVLPVICVSDASDEAKCSRFQFTSIPDTPRFSRSSLASMSHGSLLLSSSDNSLMFPITPPPSYEDVVYESPPYHSSVNHFF